MSIILTLVCVITMQYFTEQFGDQNRFLNFIFVILMTFICFQSIGSTVAIIFAENLNILIFSASLIFITNLLFNNFNVKIDPDMYFYSKISEFSIYYYNNRILFIIIYGFGRCSPGYYSKVLIEFDLMPEDIIYQECAKKFLYYYLILISLQFIVFYLKINLNFSINISTLFTSNNTKQSEHTFYDHCIIELEELARELSDLQEQLSLDVNEKNHQVICWKNLSYIENNLLFKTNGIKILDNISGYFMSNSLNAVMGPSGAGKTTFLKCLSGRYQRGLTDDTNIYYTTKRRVKTCFIVQNVSEHLLIGLTVRQTLLYASKLKNSQIIPNLDHNQNIEDLVSKLLICDILDKRVDTCSGGECKRIAIAAELTSHIKPTLLYIDEPTSGLDSHATEKVIIIY